MARAKLVSLNLYNQELKETFIKDQKDSMRMNYICAFRASADYERKAGKDLNTFSVKELEEYYRFLNKSSVRGLMVVHNSIRRYIRWCYNKGYISQYDAYIEDIKETTLSKYCNKVALRNMLIDRETILEWIKELKKDSTYYNPRDSFMLLGLFEGITGYKFGELTDIKKKEVYKKDGLYYADLGSRIILISKELYDIAQEAIETTEYYCRNRHGTVNVYKLLEEDTIVRLVNHGASKDFCYNAINKNIKQLLKAVDAEYMTPKDIITSGKVYLVKTKAEEHGMSLINYLWSQYFIDEICYQFGMSTENISNHVITFKLLLGLM